MSHYVIARTEGLLKRANFFSHKWHTVLFGLYVFNLYLLKITKILVKLEAKTPQNNIEYKNVYQIFLQKGETKLFIHLLNILLLSIFVIYFFYFIFFKNPNYAKVISQSFFFLFLKKKTGSSLVDFLLFTLVGIIEIFFCNLKVNELGRNIFEFYSPQKSLKTFFWLDNSWRCSISRTHLRKVRIIPTLKSNSITLFVPFLNDRSTQPFF